MATNREKRRGMNPTPTANPMPVPLVDEHVQAVYRNHLPARKGWVIVDNTMKKIAPNLCYLRGDGLWSISQAVCFPTREEAEAYAAGKDWSLEYHEIEESNT